MKEKSTPQAAAPTTQPVWHTPDGYTTTEPPTWCSRWQVPDPAAFIAHMMRYDAIPVRALDREEYEAHCAACGVAPVEDAVIARGQGQGDYEMSHYHTAPENRAIGLAGTLHQRRAWALTRPATTTPTPVHSTPRPVRKTGQLWEPCERCGAEPAYMPLHLCDQCWPRCADTATPVEVADVGRLELIELDPYRQDTGSDMAVHLWINPANRTCGLDTYSPGQGVSPQEWHRVHLTVDVSGRGNIDGPETVEWLRDDEGQALLARICDGHSVEWDGSNHVGRLTDDAEDAILTLRAELEDAPTLDEPAGLWDAESWFEGTAADDLHITATTTDDELDSIAAQLRIEAEDQDVVLYDVEDYLRSVRQDLADHQEEA